MKKLVMALALFSSLAVAVQAATVTATVMEIAGKVEYQLPGKDWRPAKAGDSLPKGTIISTGFKSTAVLKVGTSSITVKPITRLSLEDLIQSESGSQTQLFLMAGRVKADVTPQAGKKIEFQVKSATATASVRGTGFEFDGINLLVDRGSVQLRTPSGMIRYVGAGEFSYVSANGSVPAPAAVSMDTGLDRVDELVDQADSDAAAPPQSAPIRATANLTINIQ